MGQISWACLRCKALDRRRWRPTYLPNDSAANMKAFFTYLIYPKCKIHIHTVCAGCCDEKGIVTAAEQMALITDFASQLNGLRSRLPWKLRRKEFCCIFPECEVIMKADKVKLQHIEKRRHIRVWRL
jgi:hypothetical protein